MMTLMPYDEILFKISISDFIALPECATSLQNNPEITKKLATTESENRIFTSSRILIKSLNSGGASQYSFLYNKIFV